MTALKRYARLEATALWRARAEDQRREVVISVGDATLTITDPGKDQALTHWSLAAVSRANPGALPALYHPDGDPGESIELPEREAEMIEAIETLRRAINRARPRPGRLRWLGVALSCLAVGWLVAFWLPGALRDHTLNVIPQVKRDAIGAALLSRIERVSGQRCREPAGEAAVGVLANRLAAGQIFVLQDMTQDSLHLPGEVILLDHAVLEDHEDPDVAAGFIIAEMARRDRVDPLRSVLRVVGLRENFRLVTTGELSDRALDAYAEQLMAASPPPPETAALLARFKHAKLRSTPYAYARDITGETTLPLIEGDPMAGQLTEPLLADANWLRAQAICGG